VSRNVRTALSDLGVTLPVLAAPMAGGPTTPELVVATAEAGSLGFLAGGYRSADDLARQVRAVRGRTGTFGVNLFVPNPVPVDPTAYARYRDRVRPEALRLGATVPEEPLEDDDHWHDKVDLLVAEPVPVVSFTFGIPDRASLAALRATGTSSSRRSRRSRRRRRRSTPTWMRSSCRAPAPGGIPAPSPRRGTDPSGRSPIW